MAAACHSGGKSSLDSVSLKVCANFIVVGCGGPGALLLGRGSSTVSMRCYVTGSDAWPRDRAGDELGKWMFS